VTEPKNTDLILLKLGIDEALANYMSKDKDSDIKYKLRL